MNFLNHFNPFYTPPKPTSTEMAKEALEEHKRLYLKCKSDAEYATKMAAYHEDAAARLVRYINAETSHIK